MHDLVTDHLDLAEWGRRVAELYTSDRADPRAGPMLARRVRFEPDPDATPASKDT
ncbi:MAG: hypothetical protein LC798_06730 [Chloroflexi bacterium]|nr:hypothetical protein [Chloroflexota bacterium]